MSSMLNEATTELSWEITQESSFKEAATTLLFVSHEILIKKLMNPWMWGCKFENTPGWSRMFSISVKLFSFTFQCFSIPRSEISSRGTQPYSTCFEYVGAQVSITFCKGSLFACFGLASTFSCTGCFSHYPGLPSSRISLSVSFLASIRICNKSYRCK